MRVWASKHFYKFMRCLALLCLALLLPNLAAAQSACTAMYATSGNAAANAVFYYNNSIGTTSKWTTVTSMPTALTYTNALSGDSTTGLLWFADRATNRLYNFNPNTYAFSAGAPLSTPPPTTETNLLGATFDNAGNMYLLFSAVAVAPSKYYISQVTDKTTNPITNGAWKTVTFSVGGGLPASGGSGDIVVDKAGQAWLTSNTNPVALYRLNLTTATIDATTTYALGAATLSIGGIAVDPLTGNMFIGGATSGSVTYQINPSVNNSATLTDATTDIVSDMGNCVSLPASPTVSKSFSPTFNANTSGTSTLSIVLGNSNTEPLWLTSNFFDVLPAGMTIANPASLNQGACAPIGTTVTNVITATSGATSMSFVAGGLGGRIPAGGCTISFVVTAPASSAAYTNTIPANSLTTTAGSNAAAATATYKVGTDFSVVKTQSNGAGTAGTTTISVGAGQTLQYVLTITNSNAGVTGTTTFSDTLPAQITPVLSVTALAIGGGSCSTATAVVAGSTQVSGTVSNAPPGGQCVVTITALVSANLAANATVTNTVTVTPTANTTDTNPANNTSTVQTSLNLAANLSVTKTDGTTTVAAGGTTSYTVTFTNGGPSPANGAIVSDVPGAGLSSCTVLSCTPSGAATCPATPANLLVGAGVAIPLLPNGATVSFVVRCGVSATGQ